MRILVEATQATCLKCKWHSGIKGQCNVTCDYRDRTGKSRIFEDGKLAYDPKYCDKYEEGDRVSDKRKFAIFTLEHDEYYDYKCQKIRHEMDVKRRRECK